MKFFKIDPDVPGELAAETNKVQDSDINDLPYIHYVFDCWPEADLVQAHPFFLVKKFLADGLKARAFSGFGLGECKISKAFQFEVASPGHPEELPKFYWLKVLGVAGRDDFGISNDLMLVVSENVLGVLKNHNLERCDIVPFSV